jgi:hypothetical protein
LAPISLWNYGVKTSTNASFRFPSAIQSRLNQVSGVPSAWGGWISFEREREEVRERDGERKISLLIQIFMYTHIYQMKRERMGQREKRS